MKVYILTANDMGCVTILGVYAQGSVAMQEAERRNPPESSLDELEREGGGRDLTFHEVVEHEVIE